jgi:Flp pilus assembly pilin Flp
LARDEKGSALIEHMFIVGLMTALTIGGVKLVGAAALGRIEQHSGAKLTDLFQETHRLPEGGFGHRLP